MIIKYLIYFIFLLSTIAFIFSSHYLEAGIMFGGLSIVLLAERNEKTREILKKLF